jgi:hypothetical protein
MFNHYVHFVISEVRLDDDAIDRLVDELGSLGVESDVRVSTTLSAFAWTPARAARTLTPRVVEGLRQAGLAEGRVAIDEIETDSLRGDLEMALGILRWKLRRC